MTNEQYYSLLEPYQNACQMMLTRLEVLNHNLYARDTVCPIHTMQHRMKEKNSIEKKLEKKHLSAGIANARAYLLDVAGIRIICYFVSDIFHLVEAVKKQSDLIVIRERDYIANPKPNGYRSYHIVVGMPVYYRDAMEYFPVEIQLRTMAMDFWASMEHRICYKKNPVNEQKLRAEFEKYAGLLEKIEKEFEHYNGESVTKE
ncbi:MAG TPA: (p)ppGpp synthetase [Candidatus Eisenbergiella merdipullorum]|uniref:(P)ppGpp synthetase n=1 Tax=Candidatus Eisenbergiella merdipullorum TaxID=2838553 RepID=A0A9D2I5D6_9FIRM|nr:(p)ppGpp synthetase [Candidatus Eisenbergiella merdipullorum]